MNEPRIRQPRGLYPEFPRKGGSAPRATHYCAGCGHGILHKLIGEALADLGLQDRTIFISPVGCAVFGYYYMDCGNVQAAHGRACAVGTGLARCLPQAVVLSYQGDGDLASIGFNQTFQAANRGERVVVFFVNNAVYGMTGGQMAPTTLIGQKTVTSPNGRNAADTGYPLHVCEILNALPAPVYLERCSLADTPRIRKARRAVRRALEIQRDGLGFALVEFLSPCPTNFRMDTKAANRFLTEQLEKEFPLGCLRDRRDAAPPPPPPPALSLHDLFAEGTLEGVEPRRDPALPELRVKLAGHGGQGILRLGVVLAEAATRAGRFASWVPSYGPEQRGGTANCSVVISGDEIGSPTVFESDILVALNQSALDRFAPDVRAGGLVLYDQSTCARPPECRAAVRGVPALELAAQAGAAQAANTAMLGALAASDACRLPEVCIQEALQAAFAGKAAVIETNRAAFAAAAAWFRAHAAAP